MTAAAIFETVQLSQWVFIGKQGTFSSLLRRQGLHYESKGISSPIRIYQY